MGVYRNHVHILCCINIYAVYKLQMMGFVNEICKMYRMCIVAYNLSVSLYFAF